MFIDINKDKIHEIQMSWYSWRNNASTTTMVLLSFLVACFTGLMAQVSIAIPWRIQYDIIYCSWYFRNAMVYKYA